MRTTVDHVAIVVKDLDAARSFYESLGFVATRVCEIDERYREDPAANAYRGVGMKASSGPALWLMQPLRPDGPLARFLSTRGPGIHHVGLATSAAEALGGELEKQGTRMLRPVQSFPEEGQKRGLIHPGSAQGVLLELVERLALAAPRALAEEDAPAVRELLEERWGSVLIARRGGLVNAAALEGFCVGDAGALVGLVTVRIEGEAAEIVTLDSRQPRCGLGSALVGAAEALAGSRGCRRVWLVTTNDNLAALSFYQRRGYRLTALYPGAVTRARRVKPEIPECGIGGIPIRDELELEKML
ncbi:MAG: GNAT family N-acetyltransferase [Candidatus Wallbacteria bacterium]|nr:GNAT family N-acetyltransferase [Candidatus Wallbacteria bacterium]